jgi:hypothetical protein
MLEIIEETGRGVAKERIGDDPTHAPTVNPFILLKTPCPSPLLLDLWRQQSWVGPHR